MSGTGVWKLGGAEAETTSNRHVWLKYRSVIGAEAGIAPG